MEIKDNAVAVAREESKQFIVVKMGVEQYGINIQYVQNIVRMMNITRVPKAKEYIKGVVNLRGDIIPVMSIRSKFNLEDDVYANETRIIFVKVDGNEIGLIVDEVREVITLTQKDIDLINNEGVEDKDNYLYGVGKVGSGLVTLLDVEALINIGDTASK